MIKFYASKQSQSPSKKIQIKQKNQHQEQFLFRYRKYKLQQKLSPIKQESNTINTSLSIYSPELIPKNHSVSIERCNLTDKPIINYLKPLHMKQKSFEYNLIKGTSQTLQSQQSSVTQRSRKYSYSIEVKSIDTKPQYTRRADSINQEIFQPSQWTHSSFVSEF